MVTVLMSVYDTPPALLEQAIASIAAQTCPKIEFLILDDGGKDPSTLSVLEQAAEHWPQIRLCHEPHRGLTATLNRGLALASGELIARQDADDWSEPQRIERQLAFHYRHPGVGLIGTGAFIHRSDGKTLWRVRMPETHSQILDAFPRRNPFFHGSVLFSRDAALELGGYREELLCSQDYDLFWRLAEARGAANLPEPLYHYRYTAGSVSASRALEQARAHSAIRRLAAARREGRMEDPASALKACSPDPHAALLRQADCLLLAGEFGAAAKNYLSLLRSRPRSLRTWGKLARLAIFRALPCARELCFR